MGRLRRRLVHTARRVRVVDDVPTDEDDWIEGEPGDAPAPQVSAAFPVLLFLPLGTEDDDRPRSRKVSRPLMLWEPQGDGVPQIAADDELFILAPELAGFFEPATGEPAGTGRWQVDGRPQPFGKPGSVIGAQANLKAVTG